MSECEGFDQDPKEVLKKYIENVDRERALIRPFLILLRQLHGAFQNEKFREALFETLGNESIDELRKVLGIPDKYDAWTQALCDFVDGSIEEKEFWEITDTVIDHAIEKAHELADQAEDIANGGDDAE